ncbi:hypothetical protein ACIO3O_37775 [Streptomyces sp. NPDC087440]|uniref:hypothetical protein n=1 Tax=Streptomyces sp. NPDC087440 TaxID=3365790 RepID=UPI0038172A1A
MTKTEEKDPSSLAVDGTPDLVEIRVRAALVSGARILPDWPVINSHLADMESAHRIMVGEIAASPVSDGWVDKHRVAIDDTRPLDDGRRVPYRNQGDLARHQHRQDFAHAQRLARRVLMLLDILDAQRHPDPNDSDPGTSP